MSCEIGIENTSWSDYKSLKLQKDDDIYIGECKSVENGEKTPLQTICSVQADYRGHFELGFGQQLVIKLFDHFLNTYEDRFVLV